MGASAEETEDVIQQPATRHITRDEWNALITDPGKPLLNKAIQAQLAPGSVFKTIMSTAGLQEGVAQKLVVNCGGGKTFYGRFFNFLFNWFR